MKKMENEWILMQQPVEYLQSLRENLIYENKNIAVDKEKTLNVQSDQCEIEINWKPSLNSTSGIKLAAGEGKPVMIGYNAKKDKLFIDRTEAGNNSFNGAYAGLSRYATKLHLRDGWLKLHIYFDKSIIEVFANDGEVAITAQIFPNTGNNKIGLFSNDEKNNFDEVKIWEMKSIW